MHESVTLTARVGTLPANFSTSPIATSPIISKRSIATRRWPRGRCTSPAGAPGCLQLAGHPPLAFLRNYVARGGFRDGPAGFIVSAMNAYYVFLKFAKLWELQQGDARRRPASDALTS